MIIPLIFCTLYKEIGQQAIRYTLIQIEKLNSSDFSGGGGDIKDTKDLCNLSE